MIHLPADTLNDYVQLTEPSIVSLALEAVGQGATRQQSVPVVGTAVRRKVLDEVAEHMLGTPDTRYRAFGLSLFKVNFMSTVSLIGGTDREH